jgi:hypothetical protein
MMEDLLEREDEKRVDACGRQGGVAGKLVADVSNVKKFPGLSLT